MREQGGVGNRAEAALSAAAAADYHPRRKKARPQGPRLFVACPAGVLPAMVDPPSPVGLWRDSSSPAQSGTGEEGRGQFKH